MWSKMTRNIMKYHICLHVDSCIPTKIYYPINAYLQVSAGLLSINVEPSPLSQPPNSSSDSFKAYPKVRLVADSKF